MKLDDSLVNHLPVRSATSAVEVSRGINGQAEAQTRISLDGSLPSDCVALIEDGLCPGGDGREEHVGVLEEEFVSDAYRRVPEEKE
jgi:hypothetical protein